LGWAGEKGYVSGYFSPAALLDDRFQPSAFSPLFDNPENILKFRPHVPFLYIQSQFRQALHVSGVIYDMLTLTRIDRLQDNLLLLIYLLLLGVLIVLTGRLGIEPAPEREQLAALSPFVRWVLRVRPYYSMAAQFLLGGLFSAYAIFYSRSATLTSTAVFFALLVVLLVGNEFLRDRLASLRLLVSLYALVCFAFSPSFSRS
jgi:hypothetical protein